jgi:hypothetical protein
MMQHTEQRAQSAAKIVHHHSVCVNSVPTSGSAIPVIQIMPDMDVDEHFGDGLKQYYITKIEELQLVVNEKTQNLRRLQAQRNELNAKGNV